MMTVDSCPFSKSDISKWALFGPHLHRKPASSEEEEHCKGRKHLKKEFASQLGWTEKRVENALDALVRESEEATKYDWDSIFPRYPTTQDGFVQSFASNQPEEYLPILKKYGVVVIQALPDNVCDETVRGLIDEANRLQRNGASTSIDLQDSSTWSDENWPSGTKFLFDLPTVCPAAWKVRLHPNLQRIFTEIYQTPNLVCSVDKWLVARGTRNIAQRHPETGETETIDRVSEWEQSLPLHVHLDPWRYKQEQAKHNKAATSADQYIPSYMAVVALVDCPEEVGGHVTVPGSAPFLDTWANENVDRNPENPAYSYYVHKQERLLKKYKQNIPLRKGEMVVWDLRQFHGTFTNTSSTPRIAQFVRYIPSSVWFQKLDRFSPQCVYERWPELRIETEKCLDDELDSTQQEKSIAGLCRKQEEPPPVSS